MTEPIKLPTIPEWGAVHTERSGKVELHPQQYRLALGGAFIRGAKAAIEPYAKRIADLEAALQSQDREDAERWRYWKKWLESDESDGHQYPPEVDLIWHKRPDLTFDDAIDHARRVEGEANDTK